MQRLQFEARADWIERTAQVGLTFDDEDEGPAYWNEGAAYQFSGAEIERLENATQQLDTMCLAAVEHVIERGLWDEFEIPFGFQEWIRRSWETQERTIYGRFDLWFDGRDIKLLEFNADTPTGLIEAAVVQWHWLQDRFGDDARVDQFNSIHERLIEAWTALRAEVGAPLLHVTSIDDGYEDYMTANYLRDTAIQAGFETRYLPIDRVGWNERRGVFTDESETEISLIFKLYPWEWLLRERFGFHLTQAATRWIEAPWKMLLSNKTILAVLWELFPDHPLLLRTQFKPWSDSYARKPRLGREGANTLLMRDNREIGSNGGPYDGPVIYQELCPLPEFDGHYPVCGSWLVNGWACGLGIREDDGLITSNGSRFVPHLMRD